ncbi:polyamine ABC transporter substrate-binding protein [Leucobacter sp. OLJS4]|uniref:ABC transporter substrate-binding protein n=1 Tax=unclassified Leucobacter TaxID=2621730 RepID=UPI000C19A504|nr:MULTISPECIES: spermidine/putrescine ABC transporter substrate-binding protein [unclassified Leucobacter]PIJ43693.1 polyamine ABC transporter substrate-binding protein [Leucobacter sp. OLES1]PII85318.1 polyamine ABC transporter substrate-binding protein [Leucobacter sp. OLCALW19]PII93098.1 polyamine ABC transporter substrate-binding protein [Leucobacter sp. OLAS13]PII95970.1 polyamine ABC transporter substrate-binding protein [Leucobacter sp. OLTLW20]PII99230.1 polyamine ABC transporter subs
MNRVPEDPIVRDLVAMVRGAQMNRRGLLRLGAAGAAGAGALALSACAGGAPKVDQGTGKAGSIVWGNWTYYLDYDSKTQTFPTLDAFMKQTNIKVEYLEDIDDNNTFYGKIKDQLKLGQDTGYDVITLTDWMDARLIEAKQIQEFDYANLANVTANLIDSQKNALDVDPGRRFTIPWQLPASGFVWNKKLVPQGVRTLEDFMRPELKGKVGVLTEMRDTMGIIMQAQGVDVAQKTWGDAEFDRALQWLDDGLKSGQISKVKGNSYTQDLEKEDTLAAIAWTGDIVMLNAEQGDQWTLEVPESGGMITADSLTVPNGTSAKNKKLVEQLIDYYYQPEIAAQVVAYTSFVPPVKGAKEAMAKIDPKQVDNPLIFPDAEMDKRLHNFRTLTPQEDKKYTAAFNKVLGL